MESIGDRILAALYEALTFMWHFSLTQLSALFNQPWQGLPWWKSLLILVLVVIVALALWSHIVSLLWRLVEASVALLQMFVGFFVLGLLAFAANWFIRAVPNNLIAFN